VGPIRQQQRRLTEAQTLELVDRYESGATVYELAKEFRYSRQTVSERLKKAGVTLRHQSPTLEVVDAMVRLYLSEPSLVEVGKQLGFCANTVALAFGSAEFKFVTRMGEVVSANISHVNSHPG
jgi:predicted DNA-binding protein YlxM (UPF0122 family)